MEGNKENLILIDEDRKVLSVDNNISVLSLSYTIKISDNEYEMDSIPFRLSLVQKIELAKYLNESISDDLNNLCN